MIFIFANTRPEACVLQSHACNVICDVSTNLTPAAVCILGPPKKIVIIIPIIFFHKQKPSLLKVIFLFIPWIYPQP